MKKFMQQVLSRCSKKTGTNSTLIAVALMIGFLPVRAGAMIPYDPSTMHFSITLQESQDCVRAWAGNPALELSLLGVSGAEEDPPLISEYADWEFVFECPTGPQQFSVDAWDGYVVFWTDLSVQRPYSARLELEDSVTPLPDEQLREAARQFAAAKYEGFIALNLQLDLDYQFIRRLPNGVWDSGFVATVMMDTYTGVPWGYVARREGDLTISTDPLIDQATAEAAATTAFADWNARSVFPLYGRGLWVDRDSTGIQRLAWAVVVVWSEIAGYTQAQYEWDLENMSCPRGWVCLVLVDAHTGEPFGRDGGYLGPPPNGKKEAAVPLATPHRQPIAKHTVHCAKAGLTFRGAELDTHTPPVIIGGHPHLCARHLSILGYRVTWENRAVVARGERTLRFALGSRKAEVDGRAITIPRPPRALYDRAYIPLDTLRVALGDVVRWNPSSKAVDIITP